MCLTLNRYRGSDLPTGVLLIRLVGKPTSAILHLPPTCSISKTACCSNSGRSSTVRTTETLVVFAFSVSPMKVFNCHRLSWNIENQSSVSGISSTTATFREGTGFLGKSLLRTSRPLALSPSPLYESEINSFTTLAASEISAAFPGCLDPGVPLETTFSLPANVHDWRNIEKANTAKRTCNDNTLCVYNIPGRIRENL